MSGSQWSLLSSHGVVLCFIAMRPNATMREMSQALDLTERSIYKIMRDLHSAEMIDLQRVGRTNVYGINPQARFINPLFGHMLVGDLIDLLRGSKRSMQEASPQSA